MTMHPHKGGTAPASRSAVWCGRFLDVRRELALEGSVVELHQKSPPIVGKMPPQHDGRRQQQDHARESYARAKEIVPTMTVALYEKGTRLAWRGRDEIIDALIGPLRALGVE